MQKLQENWQDIRDEGLKQINEGKINDVVRSQDLDKNIPSYTDGWVRGWTGDPDWLNYGLIYNSRFMKKNCKKCPKTWKLLKKICKKENIVIAGYSLLKPRSSIPPHIDENVKEYKVFHIGLSVSEAKKCLLIVEAEVHFHENGKLIEFDDRLKHSAVNATDEDRLILYVKCHI